jgi:hypothetical protein
MEILTDLIVSASERAEADEQAGNLLADLERRQDDVLAQLDELDRRVSDLLRGLGVTLIEDSEAIEFVDESVDESESTVSLEISATLSSVAASSPGSQEPSLGSRQDDLNEMTVGFAKLPKGDTKPHGKRSKTAFNDSASWDQKSRAA